MRYDSAVPRLPEPLSEPDPVIEAYKKDVDRTLLRENLKLTPIERLRQLQDQSDAVERLHSLARRPRAAPSETPR
jgi:hypothetical protein